MQSTNVVQIINVPLKRTKSTPERRAGLRKASIEDVRGWLADHSRVSVKRWVQIGNGLIAVKDSADKDGPGVFASLFATSVADRDDVLKFPFSHSTAKQIMCIAGLSVTTGNSERLPPSWRVLYELSKLPTERLDKLIESGAVHPMMTRAEAIKLAGQKKKAAPKAMSVERAYSTTKAAALRLFKIVKPDHRAREFLNLMHDCGITLEQLKEADK
ncbi:MAG: hypothetical protein OEQ39_01875 [Gammaproteobacteria bacterium]|nr:hypothetical protein [Gammaproteobacteria bacterium]